MKEKSAKAAPPKSETTDDGGLYPEYFVYILRSCVDRNRTYTGRSEDPKQRLTEHNQGSCLYTAKYRPWRMESIVGFADPQKAITFERYLKSGSGRAFSKKHFG